MEANPAKCKSIKIPVCTSIYTAAMLRVLELYMITRKVKNGYSADHGCRVARIDKELFYSLDMTLNEPGRTVDDNVAEIIGEGGGKGTVARCFFLHRRDHGKGIIRLDSLTRNEAAVEIGERVAIKKAKKIPAEKVIVTFSQPVPSDYTKRYANLLEGEVLMRGEKKIWYGSDGIDKRFEPATPDADVVVVTIGTVVEFRVGNVISTSTDDVCDNCGSKNLEHWYTLQSRYGEILRRLCVKCGTADLGGVGAVKGQ
jgi:hypothetical protein